MPDEPYHKVSTTERTQDARASRAQSARDERTDPHQLIADLRSELAAVRGEVAATKAKAAALEAFNQGLNGQGGIDVTGNTITFNKKLEATGHGSGSIIGTKQVIISDNGTLNYYNIAADFVGAV